MAGLTVHWGAVPGGVQSALRRVSAWPPCQGFYLAGGTALALLEGHRASVDRDLFSPSFTDAERLASDLCAAGPGVAITLIAPRTVYASLDGVQVSFSGTSYPLLEPAVVVEAGVLPLASTVDIGAMKLAAIASRGARKDFVDLWLILSRHWELSALLEAYERTYATRDFGHVVRSLVYFEDADAAPALPLLVDVSWPSVRAEMERRVEEVVRASW